MPNPTPSDLHVSRPLTNVSVAYMQEASAFIASNAFPSVPVAKKADQYYVWDRGDWNRVQARERAPGTESAGGGWRVSTDAYLAIKYAFHQDISDDDYANADSEFGLDSAASEYCSHQLLLKKEDLWISKFFVTGVWGTEVSLSGTAQWSDYGSASVPFSDFQTAIVAMKKKTGYKPNTLVLSLEVWSKLKNHPTFLERIKYTQTGFVSPELLARAAEVDRVLIAEGIKNTAIEGATESNSFFAGKHALLLYVPSRPGLRTPSAGYTFAWTGLLGAEAGSSRVKRFRMEEIESNRVEGEMAFDQKMVGADLGYMILNAVA